MLSYQRQPTDNKQLTSHLLVKFRAADAFRATGHNELSFEVLEYDVKYKSILPHMKIIQIPGGPFRISAGETSTQSISSKGSTFTDLAILIAPTTYSTYRQKIGRASEGKNHGGSHGKY